LNVDHLVLPGDPGPSPRSWLGDRADFERVVRLPSPSGGVTVYTRRR
jgi:hypothetical protein